MAATKTVSGKDAGITFAGGYVVKCSAWTVWYECEEVDNSGLGDDWEEVLGGIKRWGGTFTCNMNSASLSTLSNLAVGAAVSTADFIFDATATTDGKLSGTILVQRCEVAATTNSGRPIALTFTFRGSGELSMTAAA